MPYTELYSAGIYLLLPVQQSIIYDCNYKGNIYELEKPAKISILKYKVQENNLTERKRSPPTNECKCMMAE